MWHPLAGRTGGAIGCDLAGGRLRLARCVGGPPAGAPALQAFETDARVLPGPPPEGWTPPAAATAGILREALRRGLVRGRNVIACLPSDAVTFRTLRLAPMDDADLRNAVAWKLASEMGIAADQLVAQVVTCGRVTEAGKPRLEVVAVAARIEDVTALLDVLNKAGARARAIDVSACAAARCMAALPGQDGGGMMLELGRTSATLALVVGGELAFVRPVGGGLGAYHRTRSQRLGAGKALGDGPAASPQGAQAPRGSAKDDGGGTHDPARAAAERAASAEAGKLFARELARDISLALNYYEETLGGTAPGHALLVSAEELPDEAYAALALQTGVKFEPLRWTPPGAAAPAPPGDGEGAADPPGAWATALGLALYDHEGAARAPAGGAAGGPAAGGQEVAA